jgi:8-amino-7-oxononanoate synthase
LSRLPAAGRGPPFLDFLPRASIICPPEARRTGGQLDLFDKCRKFDALLALARLQKHFYYSRPIAPAAAPVTRRDGRELVNLGSNNYLGLTEHPAVKQAAQAAIEQYGTGCAGSRLLTGTTPLHLEMEKRLAEFKSAEAAVSFSTGFMALAATTSAIAGEGDFIFSDELNHASTIDGCRFSKATTVVFRHLDMSDLDGKLAAAPKQAARLIVTDGVFSMEGDVCNLPELRVLADRHKARLMVDDAHATGVLGRTGRGTAEHFGMEGKVDIVSGTMSKSFAAVGGFTASHRCVAEYLRYNSRPSVFSAALPPSVVATVIAALEVVRTEPGRVEQLRRNAAFMSDGLKAAGFKVNDHGTPIIPIFIGDDARTWRLAGRLEKEGVFANPIVHPAVPHGRAIIRVSLMATHTDEHLNRALEAFRKAGRSLEVI